jgi:hypothetical protein
MMNRTTTDRETDMHTRLLPLMLVNVGLGLCLLALSPASGAADNFTAISAADKPAKAKKSKAPKPPSSPGSGESKAERDKRLLRECRGKANAGACEGFAS